MIIQQDGGSNSNRSRRPQRVVINGMVMSGGEKARDFKGTMAKLVQYLGAYRVWLLLMAVFAVVSTVFDIAGPRILGQAITRLFEGVVGQLNGASGIDFAAIAAILRIVAILYLLSAIANYVQGWTMAGISAKITFRLRKEIAEKVNRMPLRYFDGTNHGEVLSLVTNDVDTLSQTLNQSLSQIITSVITVAGVLIMMVSISWLISLVALLIVPLSMLVTRLVVGRSQQYFRDQQETLGNVNSHVEEMYSGHEVIQAFNGEARSITIFEGYNSHLYTAAWKAQFFSGLMMLTNFIGNLGYVAVTVLGAWLAFHNAITVGDIQAFIQYVRSFTQPISQLANSANVLQQTAAAAERVFEFLHETEEPAEQETGVETGLEAATPVSSPSGEGCVEFQHVRFGYAPEKTIIKDFSATILPGQKIAIVGPTGAGKTTVVKLLMRLYDVDAGAILVDGRNVRDYSRSQLRRRFGMVLQDTWLYNDTILENIRYGRPGASDQEVIAAAQAAHVDHFVHTLPGGYQMLLNEETSNLSQGQKQLLTIARAVLADPKILILDEATSSVDTRTEILIQQAMDHLMQGCTSFVIAHRLSTIRNADLILVMRDGGIVEQGRHDELLALGGFYTDLYNSQFEPEQPVVKSDVSEPKTMAGQLFNSMP